MYYSINLFLIIIICTKEFRPTYTQLGMLSALFPIVPLVALTATATEQTRQLISSSLGMTDPVTIAVNPNRGNILYAASRRPPTGDDKIEVVNPIRLVSLLLLEKQVPFIWQGTRTHFCLLAFTALQLVLVLNVASMVTLLSLNRENNFGFFFCTRVHVTTILIILSVLLIYLFKIYT